MRTALLAGVLLVGFAAPSFAQMQNGPHGQDYQHHWQHWQDGRMGPWNHFMPRPWMGAGAFYRFKRGKDEVDVHCPPNQPIGECVNAATHLMQALRQNLSSTAAGKATSGSNTTGQGANG